MGRSRNYYLCSSKTNISTLQNRICPSLGLGLCNFKNFIFAFYDDFITHSSSECKLSNKCGNCYFTVPLEVLGIQLGWNAQDAVIDGGDVTQLLLLCLPVYEGFPQTVWAKVSACCKHCMLIGANRKTKEERRFMKCLINSLTFEKKVKQ